MASEFSRRTLFQSPEAPKKVTMEALQEMVKKEEHVVAFFYQSYCPSCKLMAPVFENVSTNISFDGVNFVTVDLEEQKDMSDKYNITNYPTVVYFFRAQENAHFAGARIKDDFSASLQNAINSAKSNEGNASMAAPLLSLDGPYCQGIYEDRKRKLALFRKPFDDLEPGCVIKPISTEHETHTQIGRANRGESYFAVYLWNKPTESPGKIFFRLDFINDGTKKDRFQSAMFQVTFGYHDADKTHLPINLKDIFPTSAEQLVSHTEFDADLGIDLESDSASTRSQERVNEVFISGQGRHSPTATWNFVEAPDGGLNAHYLVSGTLPTTSKIWMKFYGKAVHVRGGLTLGSGRAVIQVGSLEKPYERILDLSEVI